MDRLATEFVIAFSFSCVFSLACLPCFSWLGRPLLGVGIGIDPLYTPGIGLGFALVEYWDWYWCLGFCPSPCPVESDSTPNAPVHITNCDVNHNPTPIPPKLSTQMGT